MSFVRLPTMIVWVRNWPISLFWNRYRYFQKKFSLIFASCRYLIAIGHW